MSACFQRLDGRPIDADVVYRYRLIDSIVDGNAKNLRVRRVRARRRADHLRDGLAGRAREEIVGREALTEFITDERKLARITAKSTEPIRQVMREVKHSLDRQTGAAVPGQAARPVRRARGSATPSRSPQSPTSTASPARTCITR